MDKFETFFSKIKYKNSNFAQLRQHIVGNLLCLVHRVCCPSGKILNYLEIKHPLINQNAHHYENNLFSAIGNSLVANLRKAYPGNKRKLSGRNYRSSATGHFSFGMGGAYLEIRWWNLELFKYRFVPDVSQEQGRPSKSANFQSLDFEPRVSFKPCHWSALSNRLNCLFLCLFFFITTHNFKFTNRYPYFTHW